MGARWWHSGGEGDVCLYRAMMMMMMPPLWRAALEIWLRGVCYFDG
jgi:hypothetical protein